MKFRAEKKEGILIKFKDSEEYLPIRNFIKASDLQAKQSQEIHVRLVKLNIKSKEKNLTSISEEKQDYFWYYISLIGLYGNLCMGRNRAC